MSWFSKLFPSRIKTNASQKKGVPEGLWSKCTEPSCQAVLFSAELERNLFVCPKCQHHMRVSGRKRLEQFLDADTGEEMLSHILTKDKLKSNN